MKFIKKKSKNCKKKMLKIRKSHKTSTNHFFSKNLEFQKIKIKPKIILKNSVSQY